MNFIRKKPASPIDDLTELYNECANRTIYNIAAEQKGEYKLAKQGWKSLHTHILFKMDVINKSFANHNYSADELYIREGIEELLGKGLEHLERVERLYNNQQASQPVSQTSTSASSSSSTYNVPTLRNNSTPQSFTVRRQLAEPPQKPRLLKTLRQDKPHRFNSPQNYANRPSDMSKIAANAVNGASSTDSLTSRHWAPSKSIGKVEDIDIFDKSFEDEFADFDMNNVRSDALRQLEASGQQTRLARSKIDDDLSSQLNNLCVDEDNLSSSPKKNPFAESTISSLSSTTSSKPTPKLSTASPRRPSPATTQTKPTVPAVRKVMSSQQKAASTTRLPQAKTLRTPANATARPGIKPTSSAKAIPTAKSANSSLTKTTKRPIKPGTATTTTTTRAKPAVKPTPTTTTAPRKVAPGTLKAKQHIKPSTTSSSRSRSQSPARDSKDTETISSEEGSVDEMELSEKEIREKMEDQIIESCRGIDYAAAKQIFNEIVVRGDEVHWDDIAGLETAKNSLKETVVYPFLRPDLFSGLREPARGMLLFGPPGTGKTMLARAVATESKSTFFSISASSLTSKYLGESEKLVRALFTLAKKLSPSIIFVDEIDSLLSARNESGEHESSRRIKNEFLIQWSDLTHAAAGRDTGEDLQRVLVLAATNLPWAIDEAARRRFVRRQYIPLPEPETRLAQIRKLLAHQKHTLDDKDQAKLVDMTDGFSGSDITALAKDAAMGPLRSLGDKLLETAKSEIRPIGLEDFASSLQYIRPSVSKENLTQFDDWASKFGSSGV